MFSSSGCWDTFWLNCFPEEDCFIESGPQKTSVCAAQGMLFTKLIIRKFFMNKALKQHFLNPFLFSLLLIRDKAP